MDRIRLGILQVNHDKSESIGDHFPDDAHRFRDLFDALEQRFSYRVYMTIGDEVPESLDEQDAFLITGSPLSVLDEHSFLPPLYDFIRACDAARKPLIGTCFGHQAIAVALGGKVERAAAGWNVGIETTHFLEDAAFMTDAQRDLGFYVFHEDHVSVLPPQARLIGRGDFCPTAAFAVGDHIMTTQAHPEFTDRFMRAVVDDCLGLLGEDGHAAATESLDRGRNDGPLYARWMTRFILRHLNGHGSHDSHDRRK